MNGRRIRKQQYITLSIIAVAVLTLSIGFAAYSSILNIKPSVTVNPDSSNFSVIFSSNGTDTATTQTVNPSSSTYGESATITNGASPTISNLKAKFTSPGQSVSYTFYAKNTGSYLAYLNYITYLGEKVCTPKTGTDATLVANACEGISVSVKVGNDEAVTASTSLITNHTLGIGNSEQVVVTINYAQNAARADGDFDVTFGDISLTYSTISNFVQEEEVTQVYKPQYYYIGYDWNGTVGETAAPAESERLTVPPTDKNYYLGYDVTDGIVSTAYACFIRNNTEYCLKGVDTEAYVTNTEIIKEAYSDVVDTGSCSFDDGTSHCYAGGLHANATSDGRVDANDGTAICAVYSDGFFECRG